MRHSSLASFAAFTLLLAPSAFGTDLYALRTHHSVIAGESSPPNEIVRMEVGAETATVILTAGALSFAAFDQAGPRMFLAASAPTDTRLYIADLRARTLRATAINAAGATFAYDSSARRLMAMRGANLVAVDPDSGAETTIMAVGRDSDLLAVDGARQRAFILDHVFFSGDPTNIRVADFGARTVSEPIAPVRRSISVAVDSDGIAYVFTEPGMMNMGANMTEVYRADPATGESLFYSTTMMRHSGHPAIDLKTHVVYCSSASDFNLSQLMSFEIPTRVAKMVQVVSGDSLDLAVAPPPTPFTRVRAVRPR